MSSHCILDHGLIGNGRVLALVKPTSAIEWLCLPRFDSPSVFGRLLDREKGGVFRFLVANEEISGQLRYLPNTNVLANTFAWGDWQWEVIDFAPRLPEGLDVRLPIEIVRILRPVKGHPRLRVEFDPQPDYAREQAQLIQFTDGVMVECSQPFCLRTNLPVQYMLASREFVLMEEYFFVLTYGRHREPPARAEINRDLDRTIRGWRHWAKTCALPPFAGDAVLRSALCLKLHTYHDTGAIIAATTTSIPEAMGTPRTWDYRYCWLRDAAFVVEALRRLSHLNEGEQFINYLRNVADSGPLQPVYSVDGKRDLHEEFLSHLAGFENNGHVRIGNSAYLQKQNDLMGELILCLDTLLHDPRIVVTDRNDYFPLVRRLVEEAIQAAPTEDTGIWEFRTMLRPYTFSRAMCWVAISRGANIARRLGFHDLAELWAGIAAAEREEVLRRGYSQARGFFTQALDGEFPDAANLLFPTIGILDARDPRFVQTVDAYERLLVKNGVMLRYGNVDDFGDTTSAFTICSFWWAESLALIGRLDKAMEIFQSLMALANPLGLFSEDVDPRTGQLLGNFPQAYTHVGLIHAAMTIGDLITVRDGQVRAWA